MVAEPMTETDDAVLTRHKLDVHAYHRMGEAGIFRGDERVELIEGELIDMAPIGSDHSASINSLNLALVTACGGQALVSVQNPVRLDRYNEPQPDFAVLRPRADNYRVSHPSPADVLLLVEVADSSLRFDRTVKLPLYARHLIPELWIVDLRRRELDVFRDPAGDAYATTASFRESDSITLALAPEITVRLSRVFE